MLIITSKFGLDILHALFYLVHALLNLVHTQTQAIYFGIEFIQLFFKLSLFFE